MENPARRTAPEQFTTRIASGIIALMLLTACAPGDSSVATTVSAEQTSSSVPAAIAADDVEVVQLADRENGRWKLTGNPDWMVAAFGSLWVKLDFGPVLRVDPVTAEIVAEVDVGGDLCAGFGAAVEMIWTCFRETRDVPPVLAVIDPETNTVISRLDVPKSGEQSRLVEADGRVWIITASNDQLMGVDIAGNTTEPIDLGTPCSDLATDGETVYVTCAGSGLVLAVNPQTRTVSEVANLPGARAMAVGEDLFVGYNGGLAQIDRNTGRMIAVYEASPGTYGSVAINEDIWVGRRSPKLTRVDPERHVITEVIDAPELSGRGGDVLALEDSIWMTSFDDNILVRIPADAP